MRLSASEWVQIHSSPSNAQHSCFIIRQLVGSCRRVNVGDCRFHIYQGVGRCGSVPELHVAASLKQPTTSVNQLLWRLTCSSTPTTRGFQNSTTRPRQFYGVSFLAQWFCAGATSLVVQPPASHCAPRRRRDTHHASESNVQTDGIQVSVQTLYIKQSPSALYICDLLNAPHLPAITFPPHSYL